MSMNVQSVVTNGSVPPVKASKAAAKRTTTLANSANAKLTEQQAIDIGFEYGTSIAGADGALTKALKQFNGNKEVIKKIEGAICAAYYVKKLGYDKDKAFATVALLKHNDNKQDDQHRTFDEERIAVSVRMLVSRAKRLAGIVDPAMVAMQEKAKIAREDAKAEKAEHQEKLNEAWDIVHPKEETDVNEAMKRLVSTMKAYHSKHAAKFVGTTGSAWRDWLAKAPKA